MCGSINIGIAGWGFIYTRKGYHSKGVVWRGLIWVLSILELVYLTT